MIFHYIHIVHLLRWVRYAIWLVMRTLKWIEKFMRIIFMALPDTPKAHEKNARE